VPVGKKKAGFHFPFSGPLPLSPGEAIGPP
jgi:hypothetical protein